MQTPETAKKKKRKKDEPVTSQTTPEVEKSSKKKQKRQEESAVVKEDKPTQPAESVKTTASAVLPALPVPATETGKKKKKSKRMRKKERESKQQTDEAAKPDGEAANTDAKAEPTEAKKKEPQQRFIVFVGNLPFRTEQSELATFLKSKELTPKSIRMPQDKDTNKPKGFAFVEFDDKIQLMHCLKLHHNSFGDRRINVELTVGGGGKSEARVKKIQDKRARITQQRTGKKPSAAQPNQQEEMF